MNDRVDREDPSQAGAPLQVLLLAGDPSEREVIRVLLDKAKSHTYKLYCAASFAECRDLLSQHSIDAIILDLDLPDSQGLDTLSQMLKVAPHLPMVAITADHDRRLGPQAIQAGAADFLDKSRTSQEALERTLTYAIARKWHEVAHLQAEQFAAIGTLAKGVAHQFNNIHQSICGYTEMLLAGNTRPPKDRHRLEVVLASARRATELSEQLIQLTAQTPGTRRPASITRIVGELLAMLEAQLHSDKIQLELDLQPVPEIALDAPAVRQALLNIVVTGVHSLVAAHRKQLSVRTAVEDVDVVVEIRDTGTGIAPADLTRLFCPFFSRKGELAGDSAQHVFRGPGLGLSISYGIVRLHGGEIQVQSRPGGGSTFRVSFPLMSNAEGASSAA